MSSLLGISDLKEYPDDLISETSLAFEDDDDYDEQRRLDPPTHGLWDKMVDVPSKPLHHYTVPDVWNLIRNWIHKDIRYRTKLQLTIDIFGELEMSGSVLNTLVENQLFNVVRQMVENQLETVMTDKTIDIVFRELRKWIESETKPVIEAMSFQSIAEMVFDFPIQKLMKMIYSEGMDGVHWLLQQRTFRKWMTEETGWIPDQIRQIEMLLLRHMTLTKETLRNNLEHTISSSMTTLPSWITTELVDRIDGLDADDLEMATFQIRNGEHPEMFSDFIVNLVDDLVASNQELETKEDDDHYDGDGLVKCLYDIISSSLILRDESGAESAWTCAYCSNYNFHRFVNGESTDSLSICTLCGNEHGVTIAINLKDVDRPTLVNRLNSSSTTKTKATNITMTESEEKEEEFEETDDALIAAAKDSPNVDLSCPNANHKGICGSILRLSKVLRQHNACLQTISDRYHGDKDELKHTISVDVEQHIKDTEFKTIFLETADSMDEIVKYDLIMLEQIVDDLKPYLMRYQSNKDYAAFKKLVRTNCSMKLSVAGKLHKKVLAVLREKAHTRQFGAFLTEVDIEQVDAGLSSFGKVPYPSGDSNIGEKCVEFRFFEKAVHWDDSNEAITHCRSVYRKAQRIATLNQKEKEQGTESVDIWTRKQYYNQGQLDVYHSYLVHNDWKSQLQRHSSTVSSLLDDDEYDYMEEMGNRAPSQPNTEDLVNARNIGKYVTESQLNDYGFGTQHIHPDLKPKFGSIHEELTHNTLCPLSETTYHNLLVKAIKKREIALKTYGDELFCKYYDRDYNIMRNEPIQVRHILAIVVYTDMSDFCTAFRATYRRLDKEHNDSQVSERHLQLYHFARSLYEAAEFFGRAMTPDLTLYHGLNKVLYFSKFTEYFKQPISTTPSFQKALEFSRGKGIILCLKSAALNYHDPSQIPKFLSVAWLSSFPNEEEKLFYGNNVKFIIEDIIEAAPDKNESSKNGTRAHAAELRMLNKFQQTLHNQSGQWTVDEDRLADRAKKKEINMRKKRGNDSFDIKAWIQRQRAKQQENMDQMVDALCVLIKSQIGFKVKMDSEQRQLSAELKNKYLTNYGRALFDYFCRHYNTKEIAFKNYKSLPLKLRTALFGPTNGNGQAVFARISFQRLTALFTNVESIRFGDLELSRMATDAEGYMKSFYEFINDDNLKKLKKLEFRSCNQNEIKGNDALERMVLRNKERFELMNWIIEHRYQNEEHHKLLFTNLVSAAPALRRALSSKMLAPSPSASLSFDSAAPTPPPSAKNESPTKSSVKIGLETTRYKSMTSIVIPPSKVSSASKPTPFLKAPIPTAAALPIPVPQGAPIPIGGPAPIPPLPEGAPIPMGAPLPGGAPAPVPMGAPIPGGAPIPMGAPAPIPGGAPIPMAAPIPGGAPIPMSAPIRSGAPAPNPTGAPAPVLMGAPIPGGAPIPTGAAAPVPMAAPVPGGAPIPMGAPIPSGVPLPGGAPFPSGAPLPGGVPLPPGFRAPVPRIAPIPGGAPIPRGGAPIPIGVLAQIRALNDVALATRFDPRQRCKISLRCNHNGFVTVNFDGSITCDRSVAKDWETFTCIPKGANRSKIFRVSLLSFHGKYLCAQKDGTVICNRTKANRWETFNVIRQGQRFGFKSCHGKFFSAEGGKSLDWNHDEMNKWELFNIIVHHDESIRGVAPLPGQTVSGLPSSPSSLSAQISAKYQETGMILAHKLANRKPRHPSTPRESVKRGHHRQPPKRQFQLRHVQWAKVRPKDIKRNGTHSVFEGLQPFKPPPAPKLLERLWCRQKRVQTQQKKKKKKKQTADEKIQFLSEIKWAGIDNVPRALQGVEIISRRMTRRVNSAKDIRDIILTMEFPPDNDPEEILEKLERIFPAEDTMKSFREYLDQDRFDLQDVERFGVAESIWFYSRTIPMVKERCSLWKFQIDFQERCSKIWDVINLIRTTCRDIAGNEKMYRVFGYVLVVGNYMNYSKKKIVDGFRLDVFERMEYSTAKGMENSKYTLLMYFVDMIQKKHPELSDWIDILDIPISLIDRNDDGVIDIHAVTNRFLRKQISQIQGNVVDMKHKISEMEKKRAEIQKTMQQDMDRFADEKDQVPEDVFSDVMGGFVQDAEEEIARMLADYESAEKECAALAVELGEKFDESFWWKLRRVSLFWKRAEKKLREIEKKRQKEEHRARIKAAAEARKAAIRARRAKSKQRKAIQQGDVQRDAVYQRRLEDVAKLTKDVDIQEKVQFMSNIFQYRGN